MYKLRRISHKRLFSVVSDSPELTHKKVHESKIHSYNDAFYKVSQSSPGNNAIHIILFIRLFGLFLSF